MKRDIENCFHLTVEIVMEIHSEAIERFGGLSGLRDLPLLESAVAASRASFGGVSPYQDLIEIAGAYLFYLCNNYSFVDGNKRVALGACIVFLKLNGYTTAEDSEDWELLTLAVAAGALSRDGVTAKLRTHVS
ncbi:type II toxin-antitoxin system death-on-curing family toxin [Prosthecobacter debontii]|nr:type II toxin-antitoxin system death-on-curing family toxin [Prosthecobacter debontii]